ncbi:hypothetical protein [Parapedobacter indicus]|uniref:Uncharacterized protein n=1 Tax=Parapedobacter indicus TaxID=1477437 RepID=A0A1I3V164_9SPHI|nr:hypothetical protein [Parapedobacter indicus]PPK99011.1 hypothetical protein CLV26_11541 [Parapedobacter indicus]SFJ88689.1 hypothetical protein SAMN05444682_115136 [Parapedobacter indicus]
MNLGFSERWPKQMPANMAGQPTYFIEKIWQGAFDNLLVEKIDYTNYDLAYKSKFDRAWDWRQDWDMVNSKPHPKLHTIRGGNRWKAGDKIHFVINSRSKNRFQFMPVLHVMSVQDIEIIHTGYTPNFPLVMVHNGKNLMNPMGYDEMKQLALNDGFDSIGDFFAWFNGDFTGQIIHWTDLRY